MAKKPKKASEVLEMIAANDPSLTVANFGGSSIFAMKAVEYTAKLSAGLATNTHIKDLNLEGCSINDACAAQLAEAITGHKTLQVLNLKGNRIRDEGEWSSNRIWGGSPLNSADNAPPPRN